MKRTMGRVAVLAVALACAACGEGDNHAPAADATATPLVATPTPTVTPTVDVAAFVGVYDLDSTSEVREFASASIAMVSVTDEGLLRLWLAFGDGNVLDFFLAVPADGDVVLRGFGTFQWDIGFGVLGTGVVRITEDGTRRIHGTVNGPAFRDDPPTTIEFTLQRPSRASGRAFAGGYRFDFARSPSGCAEPSFARIDLTFDGSGEGRVLGATNDHGRADVVFGRFGVEESPKCLVSPSGRLRCGMSYRPYCDPPRDFVVPPERFFLTLVGVLVAEEGDVSGTGHVEVSPFQYLIGWPRWTARR